MKDTASLIPGIPHGSENADLAPSERVSLLNHDIRAAMSDVIGGLRLVDPDDLPFEARAQLNRVRSSGEVLARLLEEALSYIDDNVPSAPTHTNLNLYRFVHDLGLRWRGRAKSLGIGFTMKTANDIPQVISTDRIALDRIVGNLLSNALKYAGPTGVQMHVGQHANGDLVITVQDDGPGFSDAALELLYEYAGRPEQSAKPGSGLGLRIAKELSDTLGGHLNVMNTEEGGARAELRLPLTAWHLASPDTVDQDLPSLTGLKVLVAEDNETNQLLAGQMLTILGAEYEIAPDGVEALNWLEREDFDLALIDIEMPKLNGIEVMRAFRAKPGPQATMPMIALTAYVLKSNRDAIFNAGADGIIAKPILEISRFGQAIVEYMAAVSRKSLTDAVYDEDAPQDPSQVDEARIDELMQIAGPTDAAELLDRLVSDLGRVQQKLAETTEVTDRAIIRAESHVLISLAGAIGAQGLYQLAKTLNAAAHRGDLTAMTAYSLQAAEAMHVILAHLETKRSQVNG